MEDGEDLIDARSGTDRLDDRDQLRGLLAALSPEQREAVILRYGIGLSYQAIAKATGCSLRTAQSRVLYALKNMRKRMRHE